MKGKISNTSCHSILTILFSFLSFFFILLSSYHQSSDSVIYFFYFVPVFLLLHSIFFPLSLSFLSFSFHPFPFLFHLSSLLRVVHFLPTADASADAVKRRFTHSWTFCLFVLHGVVFNFLFLSSRPFTISFVHSLFLSSFMTLYLYIISFVLSTFSFLCLLFSFIISFVHSLFFSLSLCFFREEHRLRGRDVVANLK